MVCYAEQGDGWRPANKAVVDPDPSGIDQTP